MEVLNITINKAFYILFSRFTGVPLLNIVNFIGMLKQLLERV